MEMTPAMLHRAYLDESILWERELVDYVRRCQTQAAGEESLSAIAASLARHELRRCLQARTLVRRLGELSAADIAAALGSAGLSDHAHALMHGNWAAVGLMIE
jgi:hypothetical protein